MSIFKEYKDSFLDLVNSEESELRFPLSKIDNIIDPYGKGTFTVVGGRKTSGRGAFLLNNYVIGPIVNKI